MSCNKHLNIIIIVILVKMCPLLEIDLPSIFISTSSVLPTGICGFHQVVGDLMAGHPTLRLPVRSRHSGSFRRQWPSLLQTLYLAHCLHKTGDFSGYVGIYLRVYGQQYFSLIQNVFKHKHYSYQELLFIVVHFPLSKTRLSLLA